MGRTHDIPSHPKPTKTKAVNKPSKKPALTPEQAARLAAFRETVKFQQEQWEKMTPARRQEAEEAWEQMKKSMNADRAGYRQVFVDD